MKYYEERNEYEIMHSKKRLKEMVRTVLFIAALGFILYNIVIPSAHATSLWGKKGNYFSDHKGLSKGDIITVQISENSQATHTSSNNKGKSVEVSGGAQTSGVFSGSNLLSFLPFLKPKFQTNYSGKNDISSRGVFFSTISVTVDKVLPNGNFLIKGTKKLLINNELQTIRLSGEVRPDDVDANNMIASDKIANAQIFYKGELNITDNPNPGIISKGISKVLGFLF